MSGVLTRVQREKEAAAKAAQLTQDAVIQRLGWAPQGRTIEQLAKSLELPGGKTGIGSILAALRDEGKVHEVDGVWKLGAGEVKPNASPTIGTSPRILEDLVDHPWSVGRDLAERLDLPTQQIAVALDRLFKSKKVRRKLGSRGWYEYALPAAATAAPTSEAPLQVEGEVSEGVAVDRGPEPPPIPGPDVDDEEVPLDDQVLDASAASVEDGRAHVAFTPVADEADADIEVDDDTDEGLGEPCEGCKEPAVTRDSMEVPLCGACHDALDEADPEHAPVRPGRWVPAEDGQPGALIGAWHREPGEGGSLTAVCGYRFRLGQRVWEYPPFADGRTICPTCSAPDPVEAFGLSDDGAARVAVRQFSPLQLLRAQRAEAAERLGGAIVSRDYHLAEVDRLKREVGVGRLQLQALDDAIAAFEATP